MPTAEVIDSYAKLGIAGLLAGALVYVFIFYIKHSFKQHDGYIRVIASIQGTLEKINEGQEKNTEATKANSQLTMQTSETVQNVGKTIAAVAESVKEHNDLARLFAGKSFIGSSSDHKPPTP